MMWRLRPQEQDPDVREQNAPVEAKVWAATVGGGAGAVVSYALIWLLGVLVWDAPPDADSDMAAISAVPVPIASLVTLTVTAVGAFTAGWRAKHTPRPGDTTPAPEPPTVTDNPRPTGGLTPRPIPRPTTPPDRPTGE